jgi:hypothetical protein
MLGTGVCPSWLVPYLADSCVYSFMYAWAGPVSIDRLATHTHLEINTSEEGLP